VCKPLENAGEKPQSVQQVLQELELHPDRKIKDYHLKQRGIDPGHVRRWFKKNHQLTFQAYQRMLRINRAYAGIVAGESVTSAAFGSGYESLSGFTDRFQSYFGTAPSQSKDKTVMHLVRFTTPLGLMVGCATAQGVCLCEFTDRKILETEFKQLQKLLNAVILPGPNPHLDGLQSQLAEYFAGQRQTFSVPLHTPGTAFQQLVWQALQQIPCGQTRSYGQQARLLGRPEAVRAVASANGSNRVSILIPCHRVIAENGNLTGYGGGLARKKWLLDFEQKQTAPELPLDPVSPLEWRKPN
jgi:AraC family transcriptional regulator of adaptative response/methylated-DNA-[protein]-cysteine methyltransferase